LTFEHAIVGECDAFVAVNKPASVVVHPTGRFRHNSVIYALAYHLNRLNLSPVHRLDRCASGLLLLFAKSAEAARVSPLTSLLSDARPSSTLLASSTARASRSTRRDSHRPRAAGAQLPPLAAGVEPPALAPASTLVRAVRYDKHTNTSLVLCYPVTGRLHQIRMHLASVGTPIDGDPLHGTPTRRIRRAGCGR
jgi:23S rRNA-/tRNA-specific pseudouridylate synthase